MEKLVEAFNPVAAAGVMCRTPFRWAGTAASTTATSTRCSTCRGQHAAQHIRDFDADALAGRAIVVNQHCYGCTAGAGSSCGGTVA